MSKDTRYEKHSHVIKKEVVDINESKTFKDGSAILQGIEFDKAQFAVVKSMIRVSFFLGAAIVGLIWLIFG